MAKLSFMKWFPNDWLRDTRRLSHIAKAIWVDILNMAWNEPDRGVYKRTILEFQNEMNLPNETQAEMVLAELENVASVTVHNKNVTVMSRRMVREQKYYKMNAIRQARYRSNAQGNEKVTNKTLDLDSRRHQRLEDKSAGLGPSAPPAQTAGEVKIKNYEEAEDNEVCGPPKDFSKLLNRNKQRTTTD